MMDGPSYSTAGILYAEDFDEPLPPPAPEPAAAAPTFTADDLVAARRMAGIEAVMHAQAEWEASATQARTRSLAAIAAGVAAVREDARDQSSAVAEGTVRTILATLAGLLPSLSARHGSAEVRALLRHVLPTLAQQTRIAVRVAPADLDGVREDLALLDEDLAAAIVLTPSALASGDARVTWTDGMLVRDQAAIQSAIEDALRELGLLDPPSTQPRSMALAE